MSAFWDGFEKQAAKNPHGWEVIEGGKKDAPKKPKMSDAPTKRPHTDKERIALRRKGKLKGPPLFTRKQKIIGGAALGAAAGLGGYAKYVDIKHKLHEMKDKK